MSEAPKTGGELFIVDNSEAEWKGLRYLQEWTEIASSFDIATGFFEIGSMLALDGCWQKLDKIRILMGDEMSARTRQALLEGLRQRITQTLDTSIEDEKEKNDFLTGAAATLRDVRLAVEKHIKNTYLKQVQAPVGVKPVLKCWMELN